jgi:outer membrane protein
MNFFFKLLLILFTFFFTVSVHSEEKIYYLDVEKILNQSKAGISIKKQLDKLYSENSKQSKVQQDILKKRELKLKTQKNLLKEDEFNKIFQQLKIDINSFNKLNKEKINLINKKRLNATNSLMNEIKVLLMKYSEDKSISLILPKKHILIGKSELDITNDLLVIIDKKLQSIKLK